MTRIVRVVTCEMTEMLWIWSKIYKTFNMRCPSFDVVASDRHLSSRPSSSLSVPTTHTWLCPHPLDTCFSRIGTYLFMGPAAPAKLNTNKSKEMLIHRRSGFKPSHSMEGIKHVKIMKILGGKAEWRSQCCYTYLWVMLQIRLYSLYPTMMSIPQFTQNCTSRSC